MLMALVFIFVIFAVITGLLGFAFSANKTTRNYRLDRALHYEADAALEEAVQMVRDNHTLGVGSTACSLQHVLDEPSDLFLASYLDVKCYVTPSNASAGALDADGAQTTRDVTFEVSCDAASSLPGDPLDCSGGSVILLGTARVRFEVDPGHPEKAKRARVPKIVSWQLTR